LKKLIFIGLLLVVASSHLLLLQQKRVKPTILATKKIKSIKIKLSTFVEKKRELPPVILPLHKKTPKEPKPIILPPDPIPVISTTKPTPKRVVKKVHKKISKQLKKRVKKRIRRKKVVKKYIPKNEINHQQDPIITPISTPKPSLVVDNSALKKRYIAKIRELIKSNLYYPRVARRMRIKGIVRVSFVVNKSGDIDHIEIKSNSNEILNKGATRTLKSIKAPPIPVELGVRSLELFVPIEFD